MASTVYDVYRIVCGIHGRCQGVGRPTTGPRPRLHGTHEARRAMSTDDEHTPRGAAAARDDEAQPAAESLVGRLWTPVTPSRRGPRPTLSVDRIVEAAVELADAEGIAAVSMARLG